MWAQPLAPLGERVASQGAILRAQSWSHLAPEELIFVEPGAGQGDGLLPEMPPPVGVPTILLSIREPPCTGPIVVEHLVTLV